MIADMLYETLAVGYRPRLVLLDRAGRDVGPVTVARVVGDVVTVRTAGGVSVDVERRGTERGLRVGGEG